VSTTTATPTTLTAFVLSTEMMAVAEAVADIVIVRVKEMLEIERRRHPEPPANTPAESPDDGEWLTTEQAADYLGMTAKALYSAVARRQVPASRLGKRGLRFNRVGLDRLLQQRQTRAVKHSPRVPSPGKESERW
jgi:excisionase family DNA binding protein